MDTLEPPIRALLVEDDERLARFTCEYLEEHGVSITHAADGEAGLREGRRGGHDVIILDLLLPRRSGLDVCQALREGSDVPVLMVTARAEEADRVLGLEMGADDYLIKPFSSRELLARIRAMVRRARGQVTSGPRVLRVGPLVLHTGSLRATLGGRELALTAYEFTLLRVLAERRGRVLTREQLLDLAKGAAEEAFDRSIDVRISRLRQKLETDPKRPRLLKTVRGAGYVLADDEVDP
ncbi:response regulator transcription factor [Sorangium sp. So ce381]|uniref:response regulator transcription factor n=1 Tax=Sorangium sp. So ce381 TaxID=3133307 RepID=UPI003F5B45D1